MMRPEIKRFAYLMVFLFSSLLVGQNSPPTSEDISDTTAEDSPLNIALVAIDSDGMIVSYSISNQPSNGQVEATEVDSIFIYTPDLNFFGSDNFFYVAVDDSNAVSDTATVSITINAVNDVPVAQDDGFTTNEDSELSGNVLDNDSDVDSATGPSEHAQLTVSLVNDVSNGTLTLNSDGTFSYTPSQNYNGSDAFTYELSDGAGGTDQATASITIAPMNDPPVAVIQEDSIVEVVPEGSTQTTITLDGSDSYDIDIDNPQDSLIFDWDQLVGSSVGALIQDSQITFNGAPGIYQFVFRVTDDSLAYDTDTVDVRIGQPTLFIDEYVFLKNDNSQIINAVYSENTNAAMGRGSSQFIIRIPQESTVSVEFDFSQELLAFDSDFISFDEAASSQNELYFDINPSGEFLPDGFEVTVSGIKVNTLDEVEKFVLELSLLDEELQFEKQSVIDHTNNTIRVGNPQLDFNAKQVFVLSDGATLDLGTLTYTESQVAGVGLQSRGIDIVLPSGSFSWVQVDPNGSGEGYTGYSYQGDTLHVDLDHDLEGGESFSLTSLRLSTSGTQSALPLSLMVDDLGGVDDLTDKTIRVGQPSLMMNSEDQVFVLNDGVVTIDNMTYSENGVAGTAITGRDILIDIPTSISAKWDESAIITATHVGTQGSVGLVTFENSGKTLRLEVLNDLGSNSEVTISSLRLLLQAVSARKGLELRVNDVGARDAVSDRHIRIGDPKISSAYEQAFIVGETSLTMSPIIIVEHSTEASITAQDDIQIKIPEGFSMVWSRVPTSITGAAAIKVGASEITENGQTLLINVKENNDFAAGDSLILSGGLFTTSYPVSSRDFLQLYINSHDPSYDDVDDYSIRVAAPSIQLADETVLVVNDTSIVLPNIQIREADKAAGILAGENISIRFTSSDVKWSTKVKSPEFTGDMADKVLVDISYSADNSELIIEPMNDFQEGGILIIAGLEIDATTERVLACSLEIAVRSDSDFYLPQIETGGVIRVSKPTFYSSDVQRVHVDQSSVKVKPLVVGNDPDVPSIHKDRSIVLMAPEGAIWDTSLTLVSFGGSARYGVENVIDYKHGGKSAVIEVNRNFSSSDSLIIQDIRLIPIDTTASLSYIGLSLPMNGDPFTRNILDTQPTQFGRTTILFPTQRFIKGSRKQTIIGELVIKEGEYSALIDPLTDIKLVLDESVHLKWDSNQSLGTNTAGMSNKVRLQDVYVDPANGMDNILIIPVDEVFESSDSFTITDLKILNNSSFTDSSSVGFMSLLFGSYGTADFFTDFNDSLILGAPMFFMEDDLFILATEDGKYSLPELILKDDILPMLSRNKDFHLSLPGNLDGSWITTNFVIPDAISDFELIGSNLVFNFSNFFNNNDPVVFQGLELSGRFDADTSYSIFLYEPNNDDTLAVNLNDIVVGQPELLLDQPRFWLDTLITERLDTITIQESKNSILPSTVKFINFMPQLFRWTNPDQIIIPGHPEYDVSLSDDGTVLTFEDLSREAKELTIANLGLKLQSDAFNDTQGIDFKVPIIVEYHSPYNVMTWVSSDSLEFEPSPIITVPTFVSSGEDSGYIELVMNPIFADYTDYPDESDLTLKFYNRETDDLIETFSFEGTDIILMETLTVVSDPEFSVNNVHLVRYILTDSVITIINNIIERTPVGTVARIMYERPLLNEFKMSSGVQGLSKVGAGVYLNSMRQVLLEVKTKPWPEGQWSGNSPRAWDLNWGIQDPTQTHLMRNSRYYNPNSRDFSIRFENPISGTVQYQFYNSSLGETLPEYTTEPQVGIDSVQVPGAHFLENEFPEGIYSIKALIERSGEFSFPFIKDILLDSSPPVVDGISPLPGLREDKTSGHIITDHDTLQLWLKEAPIWVVADDYNGFSFSNSISYSLDIVIDGMDTLSVDSGAVDLSHDFSAKIDYHLRDILPNSKDGFLNIELRLEDYAANMWNGSFQYTLRTGREGKDLAEKMFNFPNPFSSTSGEGTNIRYTLLSDRSAGKLVVFDSSGDLVYRHVLDDSELKAGTHTFFWEGYSLFGYRLAPGIYFGFLEVDGEIVKSKIAVIN